MRYLIVGANNGLGYDLCKDLCREKNNKVFSISRELSDSLKKILSAGSVFLLDFNDLDKLNFNDLSFWITNVVKPDVVVHCSGGGLGLKSPNLSYENAKTLINVNLLGSLSINFTLLPYFEHKKRGTVIHIGSTAATHAIGSVGYNMAKAALNAYVRSAGNHFVKSNVLICGINPGAFHASRNAMERLKINKPDQYELFLNQRIPRKEMMSSSEIISVIKFIAQSGSLALAGSMIPLDVGESLSY